MAMSDPDPLLRLRQSIAANEAPVTTKSPDPASDPTENLAVATHLQFSNPHYSYPLDTPTRFISSDKPVDLRSIWFAWQKKDVAIPDYIASAQELNEELAGKDSASKVQNLVFVERLDLITWLEGASEESEYIKGLESDASATRSAQVASGAAGGVSTIPSGAAGVRGGRTVDPRLQEIYNGERRMGDRNSVLRGIKPTDFSHVRKIAETFLSRSRPSKSLPTSTNPSLVSLPGKPPIINNTPNPPGPNPKHHRRPDPIILLSPSASSLLRLSNIKSFLSDGLYTPPHTTSTHANILHLTRLLPTIDPHRPLRFILVDTPEQFKPDYWNRVVAVFTTGQTWQFKGYKWQDPRELFKEALGVYVGWRGEDLPPSVKGWGRGVLSVGVEKWSSGQGAGGRWRDREVVEGIWGRVEEWMRGKGWGKEGLGR
ncbi:accessory factor associated with RNA polymerase II [Xanthoria calcicola]